MPPSGRALRRPDSLRNHSLTFRTLALERALAPKRARSAPGLRAVSGLSQRRAGAAYARGIRPALGPVTPAAGLGLHRRPVPVPGSCAAVGLLVSPHQAARPRRPERAAQAARYLSRPHARRALPRPRRRTRPAHQTALSSPRPARAPPPGNPRNPPSPVCPQARHRGSPSGPLRPASRAPAKNFRRIFGGPVDHARRRSTYG